MRRELALTWSGSGPAIVLLHGGGPGCSSASDFARVLPALEAHGTVYAIDLHNYGESADVMIDGPAALHHAAQLAHTLDQQGLRDVVLVCQSLGGLAALVLAAERPDLVARLVITGSQPLPADVAPSDWKLGPRLRSELFAAGGPDEAGIRALLVATEWHDGASVPDELVHRRLAAARRHHDVIPGDHLTARGGASDLRYILPRVAQPVLLIWGQHDPFAGPEYAARVADELTDAELHVVADSAHHPQTERPEAYLRIVLPFITGSTAVRSDSKETSNVPA